VNFGAFFYCFIHLGTSVDLKMVRFPCNCNELHGYLAWFDKAIAQDGMECETSSVRALLVAGPIDIV